MISLKELNSFNKEKIVFYFVSPHIKNLKTLKAIHRSGLQYKTVYLYHEPITKEVKKNLYKDRGFSFSTLKYVFGLSLFNGKRLVKKFDYIILPSTNAQDIFEKDNTLKKYPHSILHLLFLSEDNYGKSEKRYFSYIGTVANDHGFSEFIDYLLNDSASCDLPILIATSSTLDEKIISNLKSKFNENIMIYHGTFLSNELISDLYDQTKVLWLGYKHSAQSGVLPMSYMHGTPVVCSDIPSFKEFAIPGINCEYINIFDSVSINDAVNQISQSLEKYKTNCISTYNKYFNPKTRCSDVIELFNKITKS